VLVILEAIVEFLVAVIRGTPHAVFDRCSDVLLRVALYNVKSSVSWIDVIVGRIEASKLSGHGRPDAGRRHVIAI